MPSVALGDKPTSNMSQEDPEYSLRKPAMMSFEDFNRPIAVDVVIVRMLYKPGTPGRNWPGAAMVVTYYVGQKDHLLHKVVVTDPLSPTTWTTRTETNYTEVNPNLPASDFVFTPPVGSHEVTDVSALFPGGKM